MADYQDRYPQNVFGAFYVDEQCIDCDMCRLNAPDFFTRDDDGAHSFVHRQPTADDEVSLCLEAVDGCPVEAIGSDGPHEEIELKNPSRLSNFVRQ
ncbi:MAG: ferredoxin [Verrucomicrobiota bacterium]